MADPNIFAQYLKPPKSVAEFQDDMDGRDLNALQRVVLGNRVRADEAAFQQTQRKQNALTRIAGQSFANPLERALAMQQDVDLMPDGITLEKSIRDNEKTAADTERTRQESRAAAQKRYMEAMRYHAGAVLANPSQASAIYAIERMEEATGKQMPQERQRVMAMGADPQLYRQWAYGHALTAEQQLPKTGSESQGGHRIFTATNPTDGAVTITGRSEMTQSPDNAATNATSRENSIRSTNATLRGQNLTDARARETNSLQRDAARTQIITDPNMGVLAVDKGTGTYRPVTGANGVAIPGENQVAATKLRSQLSEGIKLARNLLPKATGSGAGALADTTANFFGATTEGATAATQLETLAGWLTSNVPRMQGPQSDRDVIMYRQMAASVGDRTIPAAQRLKALETLEQLQAKYADQNDTGGTSGSSSAGSVDDLVNKYRSR